MLQTHQQTQTYLHRQMPPSRPDPIATAFERTWQFINWALIKQPLYHKQIEKAIDTHQEKANAATWEAIKCQEMWEQRDDQRKAKAAPASPAPHKAVSTPDDLLIHTGLRHLLKETKQEAATRAALAVVATDVLNPAPAEVAPLLEETAKRPAVAPRKMYERVLPETLPEFLNRALALHKRWRPRIITLHPEELKWLILLGYKAGVYTNADGVFSLRDDGSIPKNHLILE